MTTPEPLTDFAELARALARHSHTRRIREMQDGWWQICCPFHPDRNPSFSINVINGAWRCHSSHCAAGSGGIQALLELCRNRLGLNYMAPPRGSQTPVPDRLIVTRAHRQAFASLMDVYQDALTGPEGQEAYDYLTKYRKLTIEAINKLGLGIGFVPTRKVARDCLAKDALHLLHDLGLTYDSGEDAMYNMLIVWSLEHTWAQGRALSDQQVNKFKNTKTDKPILRTRGKDPFVISECWTDGGTYALYGYDVWLIHGSCDIKNVAQLAARHPGKAMDGLDLDLQGNQWKPILRPAVIGDFSFGGYKDSNAGHMVGIPPQFHPFT